MCVSESSTHLEEQIVLQYNDRILEYAETSMNKKPLIAVFPHYERQRPKQFTLSCIHGQVQSLVTCAFSTAAPIHTALTFCTLLSSGIYL